MFMAYCLLFWNFLMSQSQVLEKPLIQAMSASAAKASVSQGDWTVAAVEALFALPFNDLLFRAQEVHRLISQRVMWNWPPCYPLRPAAVRKIVAIAPRQRGTTPMLKPTN
jgi:hypothetical protein